MTRFLRSCSAALLAAAALAAAAPPATAVVLTGDNWTITLNDPGNALPSGWSAAAGAPNRLAFDASPLPPGPDPWAVAARLGQGTSTASLGWIGFTIQAAEGYTLRSWSLSASGLWAAASRGQVEDSRLDVKPDGTYATQASLPYRFTDDLGSIGGRWSVTSGPNDISGQSFTSWFRFVNTARGPLATIAGGPNGGPQFTVEVSPIPEPHEWAMMLAGLALVAFAARRARRTPGAGPATGAPLAA